MDIIGRENLQNMLIISSNFTRARETAHEAFNAIVKILEYEGLLKEGKIFLDFVSYSFKFII